MGIGRDTMYTPLTAHVCTDDNRNHPSIERKREERFDHFGL